MNQLGPPADISLLRPIRGHHAFEACVEQLATAIRLGIYEHASMLPTERELADRMDVSRATLREAIAALRAAGMVTTRRGRGGGTIIDFVPAAPGAVQKIDQPREELIDALDFRRIVEPGAAHMAAGKALCADERTVLNDALREVTKAQSPGRHRQADSRFHLAIASLTGSQLLIEAVTNVQKTLHNMLISIPVLERNIDHSRQQHAEIVDAIVGSYTAKARRVMESHCDDSAALLRGLL